MKQIELTQGQYAIVDDADYDWLNQSKWCAKRNRNGDFYAIRSYISMARQILGLKYGDPRQADHIDHNTLDNRQDNLRICTRQENAKNRKKQANTSSQYKGVSWHKIAKKWKAQIRINGKDKHLGLFKIEEDAALAYDATALHEFREFANLNF